jgi:hypothetical protein
METKHLITLASCLAGHVGRSETTVMKWCGVHARLFKRLQAGGGCNVETYNTAMKAFAGLWPDDLVWPSDIPRPAVRAKKRDAA